LKKLKIKKYGPFKREIAMWKTSYAMSFFVLLEAEKIGP